MKTVILCGGLGTRLREETEFRPKPMVNIGSHPILWHIMKYYSCFGHNDFVLALGYKGEMIKNYFLHYDMLNNDMTIELGRQDNTCVHNKLDEEGWKIVLSDTGEKTLKGARLKRVEKYIDGDTFMVTYGDGLADVNINELLAFHKKHGKLATVTGINFTSRFGQLKIDGDSVTEFREKTKSNSEYINGGFFVFNRGILDYLTTDESCDLEVGAIEQVANQGQLMAFKHNGSWACMDTLRDMDYLDKLWSDGKAFWKIW